MTKPVRQLAFAFSFPPEYGRDAFYKSEANADAVQLAENWKFWPQGVLLIVGPEGSGKTHLAESWALEANARVIQGETLSEADGGEIAFGSALVLDNADRSPSEPALFHLMNAAREARAYLMITASAPPLKWGLATPDLMSRLRSTPLVSLYPPDDALLGAVIAKQVDDRKIEISEDTIDFAVKRIERSFEAAGQFVERADRAAMEQRRKKVTLTIARSVIKSMAQAD